MTKKVYKQKWCCLWLKHFQQILGCPSPYQMHFSHVRLGFVYFHTDILAWVQQVLMKIKRMHTVKSINGSSKLHVLHFLCFWYLLTLLLMLL